MPAQNKGRRVPVPRTQPAHPSTSSAEATKDKRSLLSRFWGTIHTFFSTGRTQNEKGAKGARSSLDSENSSSAADSALIIKPAPGKNVCQAYYRIGADIGPCPACGGDLKPKLLDYLIATRQGNKSGDTFMLNGDGLVCRRCKAVVIDPNNIRSVLKIQLRHWKVGNEFSVPGLVDTKAIPSSKDHIPLGDEGNPIPLIRLVFPEENR